MDKTGRKPTDDERETSKKVQKLFGLNDGDGLVITANNGSLQIEVKDGKKMNSFTGLLLLEAAIASFRLYMEQQKAMDEMVGSKSIN